MSTTDMGALRRDLLLEQAIDRHAATLVRLATQAVLRLAGSKMKASQLRNAVNVANEDGSFDVIANFIRYKIATQEDSWGREASSFGHTVIEHLQTKVRKEAEEAHSELLSQLEGEEQDRLKEQIYRAMMRRYFGYAVRAFAYYEKAKPNEKNDALQILQEAANVK
ncbi:hypothetical protein OSCT_2389 [Oscillochloris trichoides DG-6]|uniref:Uncharacterized protein n=1 Tax=Oscillochloris trichoides DG-6 TaxID=765420 RepID=E1IGD8_9CHLR|nr:hypothetical protein [Oscillochloris trichoides]EFO79704.1 hypothetical protein OSCT_2389 [Oscillochloris trichoides DG-6]